MLVDRDELMDAAAVPGVPEGEEHLLDDQRGDGERGQPAAVLRQVVLREFVPNGAATVGHGQDRAPVPGPRMGAVPADLQRGPEAQRAVDEGEADEQDRPGRADFAGRHKHAAAQAVFVDRRVRGDVLERGEDRPGVGEGVSL